MKMNFKYLKMLLSIALFILALNSCGDNPSSSPQLTDAVLTGYDMRECACCGGLMLNFDNDTIPYHGTFYLVSNDLKSFGITDTMKFPIFVKVNWKLDSNQCLNNKIIISDLKFR